ncbi:MAG: DUF2905 domain-containing protein [Nitrospirae bacterium]|nr:DUF2905 domain-containing protein [Nitrospirota bacterium]
MDQIGKFLIVIGIVTAGIGLLLIILKNTGMPFGRLPGDIMIEKKNFTFYFPIATSIIISVLLTILFYFFSRK